MRVEEAKYDTQKAIATEYADVFDAIRSAASNGHTELVLKKLVIVFTHTSIN